MLLLSALAWAWLGAVPGGAQPTGPPGGGLSIGEGGEQASVVADQIQQVGGAADLLIATGNVEITRGQSRLLADRVELNRDTGQAVAQGKVVFYDGPDRLIGERIDYNLKTGTGVVYNGSAISAPYYHLSGERMDRIGDSIYEVRRGVFTTCEGDDPPWSFRFSSGTADLDDIVYGRDASFWLKGVPVLPWFPFFAAALRRDRQSGFLFPEFGESSRKGVFTRVPYFWAINDSQDLTLTLDLYSQRGIGLEGDYRYILSREQRGELVFLGVNEFLRDSGSKVPENRAWGAFRHDWQITPRLSLKVNANVVSDDLVFRDYGNQLAERANQRAETNVFVTQRWDAWSLVGNVKWYQDLTTARPIELQRVPDIQLLGIRQPVPGVPGVYYEASTSFVNFIRVVGPEGIRADFHPRLLMPIPVAGLFTVTPFAGGRLTYYDQRVVDRQRVTRVGSLTVEESVDDPRVRRQVEFGVEAESRVSRVYTADGSGSIAAYQHVIEPRVKLIEIRGLDQKDYPTYDPGASTATGIDPGYERRTGIDRLGKANEITYYLTNSLNAKTVAGPGQQPVRWEMVRFTLSQTFKMDPVSEPFKDVYADLTVHPNQRIGFHADARYNVYDLGLRDANADVRLTYPRFTVAVGPRFNEQGSSRYVRAESLVRVLDNVDVRGATAWDVLRGRPIENRVGIDWRFNCWAISAEYVNRRGDENEFKISINLLGLGQIGTSGRTGF